MARAGGRFEMTETNGDLFEGAGPEDGLVHCVSKDLHMGKGIAKLFKEEFGGVGELLRQGKRVGQVAVLDRPPRQGVFYLITKPRYFHKPSLASLRASLLDLRRACIERGVTSLSMPRIGCGLDRLDWGTVSSVIHDIFQDTHIRIHVFYI